MHKRCILAYIYNIYRRLFREWTNSWYSIFPAGLGLAVPHSHFFLPIILHPKPVVLCILYLLNLRGVRLLWLNLSAIWDWNIFPLFFAIFSGTGRQLFDHNFYHRIHDTHEYKVQKMLHLLINDLEFEMHMLERILLTGSTIHSVPQLIL